MKSKKKVKLTLVETEFIPVHEEMEEGKFYYSKEYKAGNSLCPCGCGEQVPIPIKFGEWDINMKEGKFTITPSILRRYGCKSHYVINDSIAILF